MTTNAEAADFIRAIVTSAFVGFAVGLVISLLRSGFKRM